jgi:hypothetical protein
MAVAVPRRLPGLAFDARPLPSPRVLPRMDVAAFVGFARCGPLDVPVAVESATDFAAVFGGGLELAWDAQRRARTSAQLGPAVGAFFRNGGRRAWVVRVAGHEASRRAFAIPGVADATGTPLRLRARACGSWADGLLVGAAVTSAPLHVVDVAATTLTIDSAEPIGAGAMLRFSPGYGMTCLVVAAQVEPVGRISPLARRRVRVTLDPATAIDPAWPSPPSPPEAAAVLAAITPQTPAELLTLGLAVRDADAAVWTLTGLGFAPGHPRWVGDLPTDEQLHTPREPHEGPAPGMWDIAAAAPRFPLAGGEAAPEILYPVDLRPVVKAYAPAEPVTADALVRDGLRTFSASLFVDADLAIYGPEALTAASEAIRWTGPAPRRLRGMHALLEHDEVTIVATPDAGHRAWREVAAPAPAPPELASPPAPAPERCTPPRDPVWRDCVDPNAAADMPEVAPAIAAVPAPTSQFEHVAEADYAAGDLLAIQTALLTLCAARADMLALLSLPEHYRADAALRHGGLLRDTLDERLLAHGALYHPWLVLAAPDTASAFARVCPDGTQAGVTAARARLRGAWVAPANEPLADVLALVTPAPREAWPALQAGQVNTIRDEPHGVVCLAQDTLAGDRDLRPINVRRLIALLRRLALLEGTHYVFEPNDPVFRRSVQRGFEDALRFLFAHGAFAGATPQQAFSVSVGDPPNTPEEVDRGRLIVELRFAPSRPLAFLTVRLVEGGDRGFTLEAP